MSDATTESSPLFQHHHGSSNALNAIHTSTDMNEKLKEKDEKLSLLEYELRRAREDISNLRMQLTNIVKKPQQPTSSSTPTPSSAAPLSLDGMDEQLLQRFQREHIREHELKILNYLIKNYLVQNKYSLTAITFAEEVSRLISQVVVKKDIDVIPDA
jgi:uncharacterized protein YigA (DUF484 family)